jgi:hypothetical protein
VGDFRPLNTNIDQPTGHLPGNRGGVDDLRPLATNIDQSRPPAAAKPRGRRRTSTQFVDGTA